MIIHVLIILFTASCTVVSIHTAELPQTIQKEQAYSEKQSRIYETYGYAYLGEKTNLADARNQAYTNAREKVLKMHKTYIRSIITVVNSEYISKVINAISEGSVKVIEDKDFGLQTDQRYKVWIRAEVDTIPEGNDQIIYNQSNTQLSVKMWTEKQSYGKGDRIVLYLQGNMDFYALVVNIRPDGQITPLLPNIYQKNNHFKANRVYQIPDQNDPFKLEVGEPFGEEKMIIYASIVPLDDRLLTSSTGTFYQYNGTQKTLERKVRAINVMPTNGNKIDGKNFFEGVLIIKTHQ